MAAVLDRPVTAPTYPEPHHSPGLTGDRLRQLRMMCGLRREELAPRLGYCTEQLARIERGDSPMPADLASRIKPILLAQIQDVAKKLHELT